MEKFKLGFGKKKDKKSETGNGIGTNFNNSEEVIKESAEANFGHEENVNADSVTLYQFLYEHSALDSCYNLLLEGKINDSEILQLCNEINANIKSGNILDNIAKLTPSTLETEIYKVYSRVAGDDAKTEIDKAQSEITKLTRDIENISNELESTKERYDGLVDEYNEVLANNATAETPTVSEEELQKLKNTIDDLRISIEGKDIDLTNAEREVDHLKLELDNAKKEMTSLNASMQSMVSSKNIDMDAEARMEELASKVNEKELESAGLRSQIASIQGDLLQARRDIKCKLPNEDAINGLKGTIAVLTANLEKSNKELLEVLEEVASAQQQIITKDQEIVSLKVINKALSSKADIRVKGIRDGSLVREGIEDRERIQDATAESEVASSSVIEENKIEETVKEEEVEVTYTREEVTLFMIAAMETRVLWQELIPEYRGKLNDQMSRILGMEEELKLPLPNIKEQVKALFSDKLITK